MAEAIVNFSTGVWLVVAAILFVAIVGGFAAWDYRQLCRRCSAARCPRVVDAGGRTITGRDHPLGTIGGGAGGRPHIPGEEEW